MEYRRLGSAGLQVSALSLGSWVTFGAQVGEEVAGQCMRAAYDAGVNFFDTAEAYAHGQAEVVIGNVIRQAGWRRSDLVIATKLFWGGRGPNDRGLSRKHLVEGTLDSLQRLRMDYVDLLFCHRPDPQTPIEETVFTMDSLIRRGLVLYWGTSEWSAEEIVRAHAVARREHLLPPQMEQPQYNMFHRERVEREYLPLYRELGLGLTIWSPLASGLLTGKYARGIPPDTRASLPGYEWLRERIENEDARERIEKVKKLARIARELETTPAPLALAWCLRNPHVSSVITGATRPEHVTDNLQALDVVPRLTDEVMGRIEKLLANRPEPTPEFR
jgi:voltage-dependent potassium channel beta subunit